MTLIVMAGLPGTGKSTLANALVQTLMSDACHNTQVIRQIAPIILSKDAIRAALFPPKLIEYSAEQDDFCMDMMLRVAAYLFRKSPGRIVILDGRTFSKRYQVETVKKAASMIDTKIFWIECVCDPATAKHRLKNDKDAGTHPATNRGPGLYDEVRANAEPLTVQHLSVDTTLPLQICVAQIKQYISAPSESLSTPRS